MYTNVYIVMHIYKTSTTRQYYELKTSLFSVVARLVFTISVITGSQKIYFVDFL